MPVALLQARYTPTSGGVSDDKYLACNAVGYLYVLTDAAGTNGGTSASGVTRCAGSDGTLDRVIKTGTAGDVYVSFQSARPGEDVTNDRVNTKKQISGGLTPTKTTTASVSDSVDTEILPSTEVIGYPNWVILVNNTGASNAIDYVNVYTSPDATVWTQHTNYTTDIAALGSAIVLEHANSGHRYVKALARSAAGGTSCECHLTGNAN